MGKNLSVSILFVLLSLCLQAQNLRDWLRPDTRVPYRNVNGKLIVEAEINGLVRPFLFDTGATRTCITEELCEALKPDTLHQTKAHDSGGQHRQLPIVVLDTLNFGGWTITGNRAIVVERGNNPLFECYGVDGIIGSDILKDRAVRILSRDSCLLLAGSAAAWGLNRKEGMKIKIFGTRPFFQVRVSNGREKASHWTLIDTGAESYSVRLQGHIEHLEKQGVLDSLQKGFGRSSYGLFGEEPEREQWIAIVPRLHLGDAVLEHVPLRSTRGGSSLLGTFILAFGDMTIDYKNKRFYYEPFVENIRIGKNLPRLFSAIYIGGEWVVGVVWDEELAQRVVSGDRILFIDGRPAGEYSHCDVLTGHEKVFKSGTVVLVENRSGDTIEITL